MGGGDAVRRPFGSACPPHGSIPKSTFLADLGKERVDEQVCPSTLNQVWSIQLPVASIPLSVNEVSVDPLRGTTPPP